MRNSYPERPGYVAGSDTSEQAADSLGDEELSEMKGSIYRWARQRNAWGVTCDEVERHFGLRHQTASARIRELVLGGWLLDSGDRRMTRSGRDARVYCARDPELIPLDQQQRFEF